MENRFKTSLMDPATLSVTWELIPGRGAREKEQEKAIENAREAVRGGKVHALTITDNPGGNPAILADCLGAEILQLGVEPLVHFTCKDKNRNQIESELYALDRAGVRNLLVMSGDYPVTGFQGRAKPVFDLDPVQTLDLIGSMNRGHEYPGPKGPIRLGPSDFFAGAAVSPFKATEAETLVQYFKLKKKIAAGAAFVVTQLGYDARKYHELVQFMGQNGLDVPLVGNIFVLSFGVAKLMNQNRFPGCVVTDKLLADLDRERTAADKGEGSRLLRAARMYAVLKGMGFSGVHIGGHNLRYDQVEQIVSEGEALSRNWPDLLHHFDYPQPDGFYYYGRDAKTGLNTDRSVDRGGRPLDAPVDFVYRLSRVCHGLLFEPGQGLYGAMRALSCRIKGTALEPPFAGIEHLAKVLLYDCLNCGDCGLPDTAYVCPMSRCPKNQRNGACGGSFNGWCEVHPGKRRCIYVMAYARLKHYGQEGKLDGRSIPPCNWDLYQSSSWINFYSGKDHTAGRLKIEEGIEKKRE